MLFRSPTLSVNVLSHSWLFMSTKTMRMDSVLPPLAFHSVAEVNRALSEVSDEFLSYDLAMSTACDYSAGQLAPVKRQ